MQREQEIFSAIAVEDLASDGRGVARVDGRVLFVEGGLPGDVADVRVVRKEKKFLVARIDNLLTPSPERTTPVCSAFGTCGGCKLQHLQYDRQLFFKEKQVRDALERIGGLELPPIRPIIGAEPPYHYRNKLEFTFSARRWLTTAEIATGKEFAPQGLGFHAPGFFDRVLDIETCYLQDDRSNQIRNEVRNVVLANGFPYYNIKLEEGLMRTLVVRSALASDEWMVILILTEDAPDVASVIFKHLQATCPFVTSYVWIYNHKKNDSYADLAYTVWEGPAHLTEQLGEYKFHVGPLSFFQTNTRQAERLYDVVRDFLPQNIPLLYDLYCGAGTIGMYVSKQVKRIVGVEYNPLAVVDAERNAGLNGLDNCTFVAGDMAKILNPEFMATHGRPDAVVTDPPRNGMDDKVVRQLLNLEAPTIVYVSCNPATQARDLKLLAEAYHIAAIQPVDMFPQTTHVENVVLLQKKT